MPSGLDLLNPVNWPGAVVGTLSGSDDARNAALGDYSAGLGGIGGYYGQGMYGAERARRGGMETLGAGYGQARGALAGGAEQGRRDAADAFANSHAMYGNARQDMAGAYGQGQQALGGGLQGGLAQIGAGYGAAQGHLAPQIASDQAARSEYERRLMGGGDDAFFGRQQAQGMDAISAQMAKSGMLGSSANGQALADMGAQLQMGREQRFYDRAQGLFNGAAGQAAGMAQQAGLAGAGMYGDQGRASAGLYGQQGEGMGRLGAAQGQLYGDQGRYMGDFGVQQGQGQAGLLAGEADRATGLWGDYGRAAGGLAGQGMGAIGGMYGGMAGSRGQGWLNDSGLVQAGGTALGLWAGK